MHQENQAAMERNKKVRKILMQDLPSDMMLEIFLRLPTKSLYRFRAVRQSWRSMLCSNFIRSKDKNNRKLFLLFPSNYSTLDCYEASVDAAANGELVETARYPFKFRDSTSQFAGKKTELRLYASCDRWLLIGKLGRKKLWLLNPSTREYKEFHFYGNPNLLKFAYKYDCFFGICYDYFQNEFKVVSVVRHESKRMKWFFRVFSFETKSWTKIRKFSCKMRDCEIQGESVNGAPHWVCHKYKRPRLPPTTGYMIVDEILSFDVKEDRFIEVPKPHELGISFDLTSIGGNLFAYSQCEVSLKVCEMKEYGVKESWIQVLYISQSGLGKPLAITKRGEFIIASECSSKLYIYNDKKGELKTLKTFERSLSFEATAYIDSSS